MRIVRLYSGSDGKSHFEDIDFPTGPDGLMVRQTLLPVKAPMLAEFFEANNRWQNAPRRQYVVSLRGQKEIEAGDGTKRLFVPGDILLAEDLNSTGHIVRTVGPRGTSAMLSLPLAD